jgi:ornithine cyclodeaminase
MQVISAADLRKLAPMPDAVEVVREAFRRLSQGDCDQPPRIATADGAALAMLASVSTADSPGGTVFKLVSVNPENRKRDLPTVHAIVVWLDRTTKRPRLLVEGSSLTALRTGAATGVATDILAAPDATALAVLGAGGQALDQIRGAAAVRALTEVRIFSPSQDSAQRLATLVSAELPSASVLATNTAVKAVSGADIVCCATDSPTPVLSTKWLKDRVHINAIGSYRPEMRELRRDTIARASLIAIDHLPAAQAEAGELIDAVASGAASWETMVEIGTLAGRPQSRREGLTVFKSVGVAVQDWAICDLLDRRTQLDALPSEIWRTDEPAFA